MTPEDEEFNRIEMESHIKQEYIRAMRKPRLDQGADYERGFIDGMQYQMQSSVDKAVNAMSRTWVGLTDEEIKDIVRNMPYEPDQDDIRAIEAKLKERNT